MNYESALEKVLQRYALVETCGSFSASLHHKMTVSLPFYILFGHGYTEWVHLLYIGTLPNQGGGYYDNKIFKCLKMLFEASWSLLATSKSVLGVKPIIWGCPFLGKTLGEMKEKSWKTLKIFSNTMGILGNLLIYLEMIDKFC